MRERIAHSIRHRLNLGVGVLPVAAVDSGLITEPFLDSCIEEVSRHVELFGKVYRHFKVSWFKPRMNTGFVLANLVFVLKRQPNIIESVQQTFATERINFEIEPEPV